MAILSNKRLRGWDKKEGEDFSTWIARQDKMLKDIAILEINPTNYFYHCYHLQLREVFFLSS